MRAGVFLQPRRGEPTGVVCGEVAEQGGDPVSEAAVGDSKAKEIEARLAALFVKASDLVEKFILGSGPGGQKINKTSSCVYLKHEPSGIEIKCQRARSRSLNRFLARRELCDKLEEKRDGAASRRRAEIEKIRRRKRRRSERQKRRMLEGKRRRADIKRTRKAVGPEE